MWVSGYAHEERNLGLPSARYVQVCREGYDAFGFGQRYLTDAIQRSMEGMTHIRSKQR